MPDARLAGPRVVALGGGHGLAATLRAVRRYADGVTAIVSVADDGGSSGRLRDAIGVPAPGDLRRCLSALAADSPDGPTLFAQAFEHRFTGGELAGHALGNLVIAGLAAVTGDFVQALDEAARLLGVRGRVLPATTVPVVLTADASAGAVEGQVAVMNARGVTRVSLSPADPPAPAAAIEAIASADQIVLGPGSLYTSVLAAAVVPSIRAAVVASPGHTVYVCNLRDQVPETEGYDVADHVAALAAHGIDVDVVLAPPGAPGLGRLDVPYVERPVARPDGLAHDPVMLARALSPLL